MYKLNIILKELRRSQEISQKQLAEYIGLTENGLQNYERGTRKPTYDNLIALANYFDVSLDYLTGRTDNPNSHKL